METRQLGRTGLQVSALGFGCGAVGGLLVKGDHDDMVRTIARAIEAGITYFDTARSYGDGRSESSLGAALQELGADVLIGTKVDLRTGEMEDIEGSVIRSVEGSLKRLQRDHVDLIQLHNIVAPERQPGRNAVTIEDVETVLLAFRKLQESGKARHCGFNGLGDTSALHQVIATGHADTVQSCYNLLNPTAGMPAPAGFPFQDYAQLIDRAAGQRMGVIAIRVLAAGALSGSAARHPNAAQSVGPIGTGATFADDVALAQRFNVLVDEGYVETLIEAAIRFAMSKAEVSTTLVGISNMAQLEQAIACANLGPLSTEALDRLQPIWTSYTG